MTLRSFAIVVGLVLSTTAHADPSIERSTQRLNIATNPLGPIIGVYNVSASYALTDHVAIRVDANSLDPERGGTIGILATAVNRPTYEFGLSAPIYFRRMFRGLFIEPGVMTRRQDTCLDQFEEMCTSKPVFGPELLVGYHWTSASGWNVALAGGVVVLPIPEITSEYNLEHTVLDVLPTMYLRAGYAF